jgi:hypothetical protein
MSNLLRIDTQNVLDYTETVIQNVLDNRPRTVDRFHFAGTAIGEGDKWPSR